MSEYTEARERLGQEYDIEYSDVKREDILTILTEAENLRLALKAVVIDTDGNDHANCEPWCPVPAARALLARLDAS